jgi:hypothetical protein
MSTHSFETRLGELWDDGKFDMTSDRIGKA